MKRAANIVVDCLKKKGLSQRQLAASMGEDVRSLNQQLKRQQDMKFGRFSEVLEHIGYGVYIVDIGCRKVTPEFGKHIAETMKPKGMFWYVENDIFTVIDNTHNEMFIEEFSDFENCKKWINSKYYVDINGYEYFE